MPVLRTTALVAAPARTVVGAVIELAARRAELVSVGDSAASAVLPAGPFRNATLTGQCVGTAAGTLLTCSLSWIAPNSLVDGFAVRGPVLRLLTSVAEAARARAEQVADSQVVVGTAIVRDGRMLAQQRGFPASVAGMWELPGGRVEPGESDHDAVRRECVEELGVTVMPGETVGPDVILPNGKLLRIYQATMAGEPIAVEHKALRWLTVAEFDDVDWLPADRILLPSLKTLVSTHR